jgi:3-hydroxyisobutyrate dehydrogenase-like beta-hydroxyacid dehydrogenase
MVSEAMGLAAMAGLNTMKVLEAINKSDGWSWMLEIMIPICWPMTG